MTTQFTIRRKIFTFFGASFRILNAEGHVMGFCRQKAFKLKEDIRIYTDESKTDERLTIKARSIIDFGAAYDVIDPATGEKIGAFKRKGLKSILRDEWKVMDAEDIDCGVVRETDGALLRRVIAWIPQKFQFLDVGNQEIAFLRTHFNPFVHKMTVTVHDDFPLHPLMALAAGVLLMTIEGRQN